MDVMTPRGAHPWIRSTDAPGASPSRPRVAIRTTVARTAKPAKTKTRSTVGASTGMKVLRSRSETGVGQSDDRHAAAGPVVEQVRMMRTGIGRMNSATR